MTTDNTININGDDIATVLRQTMDENANLKIQIAALKRNIIGTQTTEGESDAKGTGDLRQPGGETEEEEE